MEELTLTTPALLFSAISLILLAYTNRFLAYAAVVRNLHTLFKKDPSKLLLGQINNLRKRLYLTRAMQILGITSLLLCVLCMFLVYVKWQTFAEIIFGIALILLIVSLALSVREIQISVRALDLHLSDMEGIK
jgi:glucose uptake protein GlcU